MGNELLFEDLKLHLIGKDLSIVTIRGYLRDLEFFSDWFLLTNGEILNFDNLTSTDVREYRQYMLVVKKYKAKTVNRHMSSIGAYINWAMNIGKIAHSPMENIRGVPETRMAPKHLDRKEQKALQRVIQREIQGSAMNNGPRQISRLRNALLILFLLNTGLRLNEMLELQHCDIHLSLRNAEVIVRHGKGMKQRTIPLNPDARKALETWLKICPNNTEGYVWVSMISRTGATLSQRVIQKAFFKLGQAAGIPSLTPHVLRHTFAKNLVNAGVGLEKVASLLGHSNINTTRIYVTPTEQDLELAVLQISGETR